jgi:hypothetical protein
VNTRLPVITADRVAKLTDRMPLQPHHLLLYSTQTWLAYAIAARFYGDKHYVWCTPYFNGGTQHRPEPTAYPPSSTPDDIARALRDDIGNGDQHSTKIDGNRTGLRRGAQAKHQAGIIDADQLRDIGTVIDRSVLKDFRPLVFVIPVTAAHGLVEDVAIADKAHPLSEEYIIHALPRSAFDIIDVS